MLVNGYQISMLSDVSLLCNKFTKRFSMILEVSNDYICVFLLWSLTSGQLTERNGMEQDKSFS